MLHLASVSDNFGLHVLSKTSTKERRETFHKQQSSLDRQKSSPDISRPRRLRVKGADTDSLRGCRLGSGETGIQVSDGFRSNEQCAKRAVPPDTYTAAVGRGNSHLVTNSELTRIRGARAAFVRRPGNQIPRTLETAYRSPSTFLVTTSEHARHVSDRQLLPPAQE
jgi:hypothetical protein